MNTNEHKMVDVIRRLYLALDDMVEIAPGWSKQLMQTSEPLLQFIDSIEPLYLETEDERTEEDN